MLYYFKKSLKLEIPFSVNLLSFNIKGLKMIGSNIACFKKSKKTFSYNSISFLERSTLISTSVGRCEINSVAWYVSKSHSITDIFSKFSSIFERKLKSKKKQFLKYKDFGDVFDISVFNEFSVESYTKIPSNAKFIW